MNITIQIDDRFKEIVDELRLTLNASSISEMVQIEMNEIIRSNLDDYGYNKDGSKKSKIDPFELCDDSVYW